MVGAPHRLHGKSTSIALGRYREQLAKRNGEWRMVTRKCSIEMTADADPNWLYSGPSKGS